MLVSSVLVLVPTLLQFSWFFKKEGTWHMCPNFWALRTLTVKDKFYIPVIDQWWSLIWATLSIVLHQTWPSLQLSPNSHEGSHYSHNFFPHSWRSLQVFGDAFCSSQCHFCLLNHIFNPFICLFVLVLFDDMLVYKKTWVTHVESGSGLTTPP